MALRARSSLSLALPLAASGTLLVVSLLATSRSARKRLAAFIWLHGGQSVCDRLLRPYKEAFLASVDLKGVVLDVGTGAGVRLKYLALRPEITKIVCVEPNVLFREPLEKEIEAVKRRRVEMHPNAPHLAIEVKFATIEDYLEAEATAAKRSRNNDDSIDSCNRYFDAVTCFLVLCTIPDPKAAVATIHDRCLKPGGEFIFVEHVKPRNKYLAAAFAAVQPVHCLIGDGCQLSRDTEATVANAAAWHSVRSARHSIPDESKWALVRVPWAFGVAIKKA